MITITFNDTKISAYIFDDSADIVSTDTEITCPDFIVGDMNSTNATVHTGVTPPADWQGGKYLFDGAIWSVNPDWTDPKLSEIAELEARIAELKQ
jgi:hypothetical protein